MTRAHGDESDMKAEQALDALFEAAQAQPEDLPDALLARIVEDAEAMQPQTVVPAQPQQSVWRGIAAALGGWPAFGSLATAAVAGLYIGVSDPTLAANPFTAVTDVEFSDFLSDDTGLFDAEIAQ